MPATRSRCPARAVRPARTLIAAIAGAALLAAAPLSAQLPQAQPSAPGRHPLLERRLQGVDPATRTLLIAARTAEPTLQLMGEQTTLLYRPVGPPEQSRQTVYRSGLTGYRCEYHAPPRLAGEIIVATPAQSWRYIPSRRRLVLAPGRRVRLAPQITPALKALGQGVATAGIVGSDRVAGRPVQVVRITDAGTAGATLKLWIDPITGAPLKTEVDAADGRTQSLTYFTQVTYNPRFAPGTFSAPVVPAGTEVADAPRLRAQTSIPGDSAAGFHVLVPSYLPPGYRFQSASFLRLRGRPGIALRYTSGLSLLSIFESPRAVARPRVSPLPARLRAGTLLLNTPAMQLAAIGPLPDQELTAVLQSMR